VLRKKQNQFNGFSPMTLNFLRNLSENNNKIWFDLHKQNYQKYLLDPLRNLVADLSEVMLNIDKDFEVKPLINKTISRIYRDTRFTRDKSLYKNTMWITFKRLNKDWKNAPAYFFEISPNSYRYGMGFFNASKSTMDKFREMIDKNPKRFLKAISFYSKQQIFLLEGEKYKKILDENKPGVIQNWYQRKNLYLVCNKKIDNSLFSRDLVNDLILGFELIAPFYHFLFKIKLGGNAN
jgi:uncharacterized protein (TIGR02453 family)